VYALAVIRAAAGGAFGGGGAVVLAALLSVACEDAHSRASDGGDAGGFDSKGDGGGESDGEGGSDGGIEHDSAGWAVVGLDLFPPLVRRVVAVPCPGARSAADQCMSDAECDGGSACVCSGVQGFDTANLCVRAECRSDADCGGRACLLSLGSKPGACCSYGHLGLFCERPASTCHQGGDCPGNGRACMYAAANDRFECQPFSCACR
jgi:hypothetical protein